MLVLCSNGLTSGKLMEAVQEEVRGCKTAALVVTADNEYKEKNYHVERCSGELENLNLSVELLDIDTMPAEKLLEYDVVEFIGGNPYYLLNSIREHKAGQVLAEIAEKKVLIGWSAAAFVFGPTLELVDKYSPELNFMGLEDLRGLCLTDVEVLPHYNKYLARFEGFEETCARYEAEKKEKVVRLNNGDAVLIKDGERRVVRA